MSEHTPGPWTAGQKTPATRTCVFLKGRAEPELEDQLGPSNTWIDCNTEANARLIAAAPELYEALCIMSYTFIQVVQAVEIDIEGTRFEVVNKATDEKGSLSLQEVFEAASSAINKVHGGINE